MARPNVLLLLSDEHNHRFAGHRGQVGEPVRTPHLDSLAAESVTFENAYCPYPLCAPSRKCMLTGQEVQSCDAWGNAAVYTEEDRTLPRTFGEEGYETCLVGKMHFNGDRQFNGFDHRPYGDLTGHGIQQPGHQPDPIDPERLERQPRRQSIDLGTRIPNAGVTEIPESLLQEQVVARETIAWLREHRHAHPDRPWLLCASFSRPHFPLTAPRRHFERYWPEGVSDPPVGRDQTPDHPYTAERRRRTAIDSFDDEQLQRARAAYFACVEFLDEVIGELLRTLDAERFLEDTVVVYASDHGEMAGEHGLWWKSTYHEGSARVPWTLRLPDHRTGDREPAALSTPVNLIDLFPTLCGLTGIEAPSGVDGKDLSNSVHTGEEPDRGPVFVDNLPAYRAIRDGRYKYVGFRDHPELLFDLASDPHETDNLVPDATGADAAALERLRELFENTVDFDAIDGARRAAEAEAARHRLAIPPGTGNAYLLPDGRLVDAGTPLYKPDVLADDPAGVFADWPDRDDSDPDG
jgi:choline-sulfatase